MFFEDAAKLGYIQLPVPDPVRINDEPGSGLADAEARRLGAKNGHGKFARLELENVPERLAGGRVTNNPAPRKGRDARVADVISASGIFALSFPGQTGVRGNGSKRASNAVELIDVSAHESRRIPSKKWRELIKKVWEADPLRPVVLTVGPDPKDFSHRACSRVRRSFKKTGKRRIFEVTPVPAIDGLSVLSPI